MEHVVRMGELAVSSAPGDVLTCIGLGSCIGLLVVDRPAGVVALAHVMLPQSPATLAADVPAAKFADTGVPATIAAALAAGARQARLEAVLVGGASMFAMAGGQEIGARNEEAVLAGLERARIRVAEVVTGGSRGRTLRVVLDAPGTHPATTVREAGGAEAPLTFDRAVALAA